MWEKQIQYFTYYHCLVLDLPEHGLRNQGMHFSIRGSAEQLMGLLHEKNKGRVIVVGFSLGAQIAIQMASREPDLIDIAVVNSALVRPVAYADKLIRPTVRFTFPLIKSRLFSKLQAKALYVGEEHFERYYEETLRMKPETLVRVLEENMSFAIPENFSKVKGRTLVTVGERERAIMKRSARDIVQANTNCTGVILPNVGHGVPLAEPDFFNHMVEAWINDETLPKGCKVFS